MHLTRQDDLFQLRRHGQAVCQALELGEAKRVRLVTLASEAGAELLGSAGLVTEFVRLAGQPHRVAVRYLWKGDQAPSHDLLTASHRLLDLCTDGPGRLLIGQDLTAPFTAEEAAERVTAELAGLRGPDMSEELRRQNSQLLQALQDERARAEELERLNKELDETNAGVMALYSELSAELEETNRGVVALYADLEDKSRRLRQASAAKTRFWANVSHELRTPVNAVISLARLLLDENADPLTAEQHQQVSLIAGSGSTLLALVEELLDTAKAESGRLEPQLVRVDLRTVLHQLRGTLASSAAEGVTLDIADTTFPGPFTTDEVMLTRVLRNILSNSLKFTASGTVRLTARAEERPDGPWAVLTVTDTGVGIPEDKVEQVFEEFYQVRGAHQRHVSGTGLGLPYARKLTELLGGTLTLTSRLGQGTEVTVELPAAPTHAGPVPLPQEPLLRSVVIIDDDPVFLSTLRPTLDRLAETTTEVTRSVEALRTIRTTLPDAVLVDLAMPPPDGYQVLQQIAAVPSLAQVPVVVLTSMGVSDIDRGRVGRARAVLSKTHLTAERLAEALGLRPAAEGRTTAAEPADTKDSKDTKDTPSP
ncbi:ATP-binding protein [Streptomyces sp. PsTaAH-124]|uniref:ATP-binding response regulator n=1 Tax=Streptomyces sp. PsTaAH-124 TaxID=1157638 RepID=UPI000688D3F9